MDVVMIPFLRRAVGACGLILLAGCVTNSTQEKQFAEALQTARRGDPVAQRSVGQMCQAGHGVIKNYAEAASWYLSAAEQGDPIAQFSLGSLYENGLGVATNYDKAVEWYLRAADQRLVPAMYRLAYMHDVGLGLASDVAAAASWYRLTAQQGHLESMIALGLSYSQGAGVPHDLTQAYSWGEVARLSSEYCCTPQLQEKIQRFLFDLQKQMTAEQIAEAKRMAAGEFEAHAQ